MPVKRKVTLEQVYAKLEGHDRYFEKHDRQFEGMTKLLLFRVEDSLKAESAKVMDRVRKLEQTLKNKPETLNNEANWARPRFAAAPN
jgi:hypothetical protein